MLLAVVRISPDRFHRRQQIIHGVKKGLRRRVLFPDDCKQVNQLLQQVKGQRWC
jgi:hypothetical protein